MKTDENGRGRFLKGFLIGSFLGAGAGVLFAPKSGKELRSDLKQMGSDTIDKTMQLSSETKEKARAILDKAQRRAEELRKEADRQLADARLKAKEFLKDAEKKVYETKQLAKEIIEDAKVVKSPDVSVLKETVRALLKRKPN